MPEPVREAWRDPEAPWWAKLRRARLHIEDVRRQARELEDSSAWTVTTAPGRTANELAYHLAILRSVPADLKTAVGDAVHNLRTSLDTAAFELATHRGVPLNARQRRNVRFPICRDAPEFVAFFESPERIGVFGDQERAALRSVQPFSLREEARALEVDVEDDPDSDLRLSTAHSLNRLSNIDKHRGFPNVSWVHRMCYWVEPRNGDRYEWLPTGGAVDGGTVGYMRNATGDAPPDTDVFHAVELRITDDPGYGPDLPAALDGWHGDLVRWVLPRLFIVASGNPPPMMISYG